MPEATYMRAAFHYSQEDHRGPADLGLPRSGRASRAASAQRRPGHLGRFGLLVDYHRHEDLPPPLPIPHVSQTWTNTCPCWRPTDHAVLHAHRSLQGEGRRDHDPTRTVHRVPFESDFKERTTAAPPWNIPSMQVPTTEERPVRGQQDHGDCRPEPVRENPNNIDLFQVTYEFDYRDASGKAVYMWSELTPMGPGVNSPLGWEAQPSISRTDRPSCSQARGRIHLGPKWQLDHGFVPVSKGCRRELVSRREAASPLNSDAQDKSPFLPPGRQDAVLLQQPDPWRGWIRRVAHPT